MAGPPRARAADARRRGCAPRPCDDDPPRPIAAIDASAETYGDANLRFLRNTAIGNILDLCAVVLPCGFTRDGLPISLMIHAKPFDEAMVLRVARTYEHATDWHRPPFRPRLGGDRREVNR